MPNYVIKERDEYRVFSTVVMDDISPRLSRAQVVTWLECAGCTAEDADFMVREAEERTPAETDFLTRTHVEIEFGES